jgi:nucleotide-binding universal stress UspA family protein
LSVRDRERFAPGSVIGGFRVEEALPGGVAASLWRVTRPDISFPLVLKVPEPADNDVTGVVRFEVERLILPRLTGLHVPRFVAAGDFNALPYFVTELVAGPSLHDRFAAVMFSADDVALLGARIAVALHEIHRQHVIHLFMKPRSVIFRKSGEAVLVDFGFAHHAQLPDLLAEQFREPLGTATYMAPEQVLRVRTDPRSDIFALGAVLYHLIAGRPPFGKPTGADGLRRRLYHDPALPRSVNSACPAWLEEVILGCLEVDPANRFQDAEQVAFLLLNPGKVQLTRAARRKPRGFFAAFLRKLSARSGGPAGRAAVQRRREIVPTIMVAVDLSPDAEPLAEALRAAVRRTYEFRRAVRLACITVRTLFKVGVVDANVDHAGRNLRVQRLAELKQWALPLGLHPDQVSFHVLESEDPATALLEYARENRVEHVVIGARGSSALRRLLGSVSSRVVAEAPCTVTVVRAHRGTAAAEPEGPAIPPNP